MHKIWKWQYSNVYLQKNNDMIKANNYNEKEALQEFYAYLNNKIHSLITGNKQYLVREKGKGKLIFANDPIFKFISQPHLVRSIDIDSSIKTIKKSFIVSKNSTNTYLSLPKLNDTYLNYTQDNYVTTDNPQNGFDPFYFIWVEQIKSYFEDLKQLTDEYFDDKMSSGIFQEKYSPIDYFIYFNGKIIKLKRRAALINILLESNPSIVNQIVKEKETIKKLYVSVRCNWIDDLGEIDRNILLKVSDDLVEENLPTNVSIEEFNGFMKNKTLLEVLSNKFSTEMFSMNLFEVIKGAGLAVRYNYLPDTKNNGAQGKYNYYLLIEGREIGLNFLAANSLAKVLSILEFGQLYEIFKGKYNENGVNSELLKIISL